MGQGEAGLRLREEPRIEENNVQFVAAEGDLMLVVEGPIFFDDIEWCRVENITRPGQFGWASRDFLLPEDAIADEVGE